MSYEPKSTKKEREIARSHLWHYGPPGYETWIETGEIPEEHESYGSLVQIAALANLLAWYREHLKSNKETTNE